VIKQSLAWFVAIFALLAVARFDRLFDPPFEDNVMGVWTEAIWLHDHEFDYLRLRNEPVGMFGGPRSYLVSVLPTIVALLIKTGLTPDQTILAYHLLGVLAATVMLVLLARIVAQTSGIRTALLVALAVATTPALSVQIDLVGMDLFTATAGVIVAACLASDRWGLATALSPMGFMFKPTGLLIPAALGACLLVRWIDQAWLQDRRARREGFLLLAVAGILIAEFALIRAGSHVVHLVGTNFRPAVLDLWRAPLWCPDLSLVILGMPLLAIGLLIPTWRRQSAAGDEATFAPTEGKWIVRVARRVIGCLARDPVLLFCLLVQVANLAAISRVVFIPRYALLGLPLAYVGLARVIAQRELAPRGFQSLLALIVVANLILRNGALLPALDRVLGPSMADLGCVLERSDEYRRELDEKRAAIADLVAMDPALTLATNRPLTDMVADPRYGYVRSPLGAYMMGASILPGRPSIETLFEQEVTPDLAFVHESIYDSSHSLHEIPLPDPSDEVLFAPPPGGRMTIYRKRHADGSYYRSEELQEWILDRLYHRDPPEQALLLRATVLIQCGRYDWALERLQAWRGLPPSANADWVTACGIAMEANRRDLAQEIVADAMRHRPDDPALLLTAGRIVAAGGDYAQAYELVTRSLERTPDDLDALQLRADIAQQLGRMVEAEASLRAALKIDDRLASAHLSLGRLLLARRAEGEGVAEIERALGLDLSEQDRLAALTLLVDLEIQKANYTAARQRLSSVSDRLRASAEIQYRLGQIEFLTGNYPGAAACFAAASQQAPDTPELLNAWGVALAKVGSHREAIEKLERAIELNPNFQNARDNLAAVRAAAPP